jgi:hypothetical protein
MEDGGKETCEEMLVQIVAGTELNVPGSVTVRRQDGLKTVSLMYVLTNSDRTLRFSSIKGRAIVQETLLR